MNSAFIFDGMQEGDC